MQICSECDLRYPLHLRDMAQKLWGTHGLLEEQLKTRTGYFRASKIRHDPCVEAVNSTHCVATLFLTLSNANIKQARYFTPYLLLEAVS